MARQMAEALHATYPGHFWAVSCDGKTGMADVRNLALSGNWGFRLKLENIYSASQFKKDVLKAGGEILERYRLNRGRLNDDQLSDLPTDFAGRLKADM
jgi:hypothetical protein